MYSMYIVVFINSWSSSLMCNGKIFLSCRKFIVWYLKKLFVWSRLICSWKIFCVIKRRNLCSCSSVFRLNLKIWWIVCWRKRVGSLFFKIISNWISCCFCCGNVLKFLRKGLKSVFWKKFGIVLVWRRKLKGCGCLISSWVKMLIILLVCLREIIKCRVIGERYSWSFCWRKWGCRKMCIFRCSLFFGMKMVKLNVLILLFICWKIKFWLLILRFFWRYMIVVLVLKINRKGSVIWKCILIVFGGIFVIWVVRIILICIKFIYWIIFCFIFLLSWFLFWLCSRIYSYL